MARRFRAMMTDLTCSCGRRPIHRLEKVWRRVVVLLIACAASAQSVPQFEVASIRPAAPMQTGGGGNGRSGGPPPGGNTCGIPRLTMDASRLTYSCVGVANLIAFAYGVSPGKISGPDWLTEGGASKFDVVAKLPAGATQAQLPQMFETLLAERFKLAVHRGSTQAPGYALVADKSGLKLKEAAADAAPVAVADADPSVCPPQDFNCAPSIRNIDGLQTRITPVTGQVRKLSNPRIGVATVTRVAFGKLRVEAPSTTLGGLADVLAIQLGSPIVDETEVSGRYEVLLEISAVIDPGVPEGFPDRMLAAYRDALFKAGLRLEPRKATVETIVVDHAEKSPTGN